MDCNCQRFQSFLTFCFTTGGRSNTNKSTNASISVRICAGITTGGLAVLFAQPTDVVKVRMQAEARSLHGEPKRYSGTMNAYSTIARKEGIAGLWKGIVDIQSLFIF